MYIPTIVIICMICGGIGGTLGYYLTKRIKKEKNKEDDQSSSFTYLLHSPS